MIDKPDKRPIVQIEQLTHIYLQGSVFESKALDTVNAALYAGECVGLIGHTGSGKSTLIQHLNALLKPSSGRVLIDGEDIHADRRRLKKVREKVGLVFQYPEHQLFEVTVLKDVCFGPTNMGLDVEEVNRRAREALALVGLPEELYEKSPFELSGGQKRRAAIAGVLAMKPEILILDEPTAGLDPAGREEILNQIQYMHETLGNTVVLVSHSMEEVARLADRIFVMSQGRLLLADTPAKVFAEQETLNAIGLDVPPVCALANRLKQMGVNITTDIYTVEAAAQALYAVALRKGLASVARSAASEGLFSEQAGLSASEPAV